MAQYEWGSYTPRVAAFRPGVHTGNGDAWTDIGVFPVASAAAAENTSGSFAYYPYDRVAFATLFGEDWQVDVNGRFGAYLYQQNRIYKNDGSDWLAVHNVVGQQNLLDYGVHTGLYETWGTDGKAYLIGIYPGINANEVGAVRLNIETGAWDSWVEDVGGKFSACATALPFGGKLNLATGGDWYTVDPAQRKIRRRGGPVPASDARDKFFILSGRLFWAGLAAGRMKVYEYLGVWHEVLDVFAFPIAIGGTWALLQDYSRVALVFYTGLRTLGFPDPRDVYYGHFSIEATSSEPLSALGLTDHTEAARFTINGFSVPIPLNTARVIGAHESDVNYLTTTQAQVFIAGGSAATAAAHPIDRSPSVNRIFPVNNPAWGSVTAFAAPAGLSYVSSRYGYTDGILQRDAKIQPYKVIAEPGFESTRLRIYYVGHTNMALGDQMSVRIYFRDLTAPGLTGREGTLHPIKAATIASTPALINGYDAPNGFNNVAQKRIDNVDLFQTGGDHYVVWDLLADLGAAYDGPVPPFQLVMNYPGNLPPL